MLKKLKEKIKPRNNFLATTILIGIFILAAILRLYKIDNPVADWHSWRQADTASVTREFVKHNYPIQLPHYHDLSNIPSGLDNPEGYRMVEFPVVNFGVAQVLKAFPNLDLVVFSRLVSVGLSLITLVTLYLLVENLSGKKSLGLLSAFFFAVLPYSIYYSRVILPEPAMLTFQVLSVYAFVKWLDAKEATQDWAWYGLAWISLTLALLIKPTALFAAPVFLILSWYKFGLKSAFNIKLWAFLGALIPLMWWRDWIQQFPAGIPASKWLFNGNGIRLKPAWWRWLFAERIGYLILGIWGTSLVVPGIISKIEAEAKPKSRFDAFTLAWALGGLLYLVIFATGNVQHDYYQTLLIPIISILLARGSWWLLQLPGKYCHRLLVYPSLIMLIALSLGFSWYQVKGYFNINNPAIVAAGQYVDENTPQDAIIIAPYQGDTAFLFQTNRRGWPIGFEIENKIEAGATYYVSTSYDDEARELEAKYTVIEKNGDFMVIDLTTPNSELNSMEQIDES